MVARPPAYFDSSVLVKRYVNEAGAQRARDLLRRFRVVSSTIAPLETTSAARRRLSSGDLTPSALDAVLARLQHDRVHWELMDVSGSLLLRAEQSVRHFTIAALDAIHVTSALLFIEVSRQRVPFVTADAQQRVAAERAHLPVVWVA